MSLFSVLFPAPNASATGTQRCSLGNDAERPAAPRRVRSGGKWEVAPCLREFSDRGLQAAEARQSSRGAREGIASLPACQPRTRSKNGISGKMRERRRRSTSFYVSRNRDDAKAGAGAASRACHRLEQIVAFANEIGSMLSAGALAHGRTLNIYFRFRIFFFVLVLCVRFFFRRAPL